MARWRIIPHYSRREAGLPLSPILFNILLERMMTAALEHYEGTVSIGGRPVSNFRFRNNIDGLTGRVEERVRLTTGWRHRRLSMD